MAETSPIPGGGGEGGGDAGGDLLPGERIGRYVVIGRLGTGGMGVVYAAHDPELERKVALKLLRRDVVGAADRAPPGELLLREPRAMARRARGGGAGGDGRRGRARLSRAPGTLPLHRRGRQGRRRVGRRAQAGGRARLPCDRHAGRRRRLRRGGARARPYSGRWVAMHGDACAATRVRGEESEALLDRRMLCLDARLADVRALTGRFAAADGVTTEYLRELAPPATV
jgi:hypothetical protein